MRMKATKGSVDSSDSVVFWWQHKFSFPTVSSFFTLSNQLPLLSFSHSSQTPALSHFDTLCKNKTMSCS
jgi:hypothetical protein